MNAKHKPARAPIRAYGTNIENSQFTTNFPPINAEAREAIVAIASASKAHAETLTALAKILSGGSYSDVTALKIMGGK